jgi:hypothetical protein
MQTVLRGASVAVFASFCLIHPESLGDEPIKRSDFSIFALKDLEGLR